MNQTSALATASVLIVEDDDVAQELLVEMLGTLGISQVHRAENGRVALKVLDSLELPPHLLICDIYMPDVDGLEFLEHLGARKYRGGIVIMSGVDLQILDIAKEIARAHSLKLLGAFVKPLSLQQLSGALAQGGS